MRLEQGLACFFAPSGYSGKKSLDVPYAKILTTNADVSFKRLKMVTTLGYIQ